MTNLVQLIPREPFGREELERYAEKNGWTRAESFADWLRDDLPLHSDDSLCRLVESTRDDMALMDALRRLGVSRAGQQFDEDAYGLLRWALHDPEPLVRRNALLAASLQNWPELVPLLTSVIEVERNPAVRKQALTTLEVLRDRITPAS